MTPDCSQIGADIAIEVYEMLHERDDLEREIHDDPHRVLTEVLGIYHSEDN